MKSGRALYLCEHGGIEGFDTEQTAQDCARDRADRVGVPTDVGGVQEGAGRGVSRKQGEGHRDRVRRGDGCAHLLDQAFQGGRGGVSDQLHCPARRGDDVRFGCPCAACREGLDVGEGLPQQGPHVLRKRKRALCVNTHGHGRRHEGSRLEALSRRVRDPARGPHGLGKSLRILRRDRNTDRRDAHRRTVRGALAAHRQRVLARAHALERHLRGGAQQVE